MSEELEALSRQAAGCLPEDFFPEEHRLHMHPKGKPPGMVWIGDEGWRWLHKSTEACCEVMVRVLWVVSIDIKGSPASAGSPAKSIAWVEWDGGDYIPDIWEDDPMLAYRVAVLRALIALKSQ